MKANGLAPYGRAQWDDETLDMWDLQLDRTALQFARYDQLTVEPKKLSWPTTSSTIKDSPCPA